MLYLQLPKLSLSDLKEDSGFVEKSVTRGLAGRPANETPALEGASRAHIECDINVDSLAYWNDPQGTRDQNFKSPFAVKVSSSYNYVIINSRFTHIRFALIDLQGEKYISFVPDRGGWNNVRMSMEIIFVIAAASGRTLVLPPEQPLYLLHVSSRVFAIACRRDRLTDCSSSSSVWSSMTRTSDSGDLPTSFLYILQNSRNGYPR